MKLEKCGICESNVLKKVLEFKKFPITGIFIKQQKLKIKDKYDLNLVCCKLCGHIQLEKFVPKTKLYNNLYANRTAESHLSKNAISFFLDFFFKVLKSKKNIGNVVEIGCSDTSLISKLKNYSNNIVGVDPIWKNKKIKLGKNIRIIGDFIERVNPKKLGFIPDLYISTHNLEHIANPFKILSKIVKNAKKDTIFFIEVPDTDLMIKNLRYDQIFHQHYHF